ncbi:type I-B CRISPR-associated protein Cas5b [Paenibacillus polymyxa]|uniref:type I-B CRISPR-associated protein Cas5b n=1 Tax=Paenibacillus polymyxa TaxID=1406 RepID=UPI002378C120|nr:type I-B CRISPR-associated protein Cas5b [Paenibacillus polymyxa]WDM23248.1 type I-B CRISPR-associated protein Cas5 [Paenibacillus polymyxa]
MQALSFELSGETAFFKKPDVNVYAYFTYSHIHKVALYGLLGAVLGLGGYTQQYERNMALGGKAKQDNPAMPYPEFYEVFRHASVSIVPHGDRGYFSKKIQIFNNTVGYASQEEGGVLNVREQWLERPRWTIYVADDGGVDREVFDRLADYVQHSKAEYIPYLGKNDHPATISKARLVELEPASEPEYIDSLRAAHVLVDTGGYVKDDQMQSYLQEYLPVGLNTANNGYILEPLVFSNQEIDTDELKAEDLQKMYRDADNDRTLYFI